MLAVVALVLVPFVAMAAVGDAGKDTGAHAPALSVEPSSQNGSGTTAAKDAAAAAAYHVESKHHLLSRDGHLSAAFAAGPGRMDWASQPSLFRRFTPQSAGAPHVVKLPRFAEPSRPKSGDTSAASRSARDDGSTGGAGGGAPSKVVAGAAHGTAVAAAAHVAYDTVVDGGGRAVAALLAEPSTATLDDVASLSSLLWYAVSLSAKKVAGRTSWTLRVNPSSGNLHPTETYVLLPVGGDGTRGDDAAPAALQVLHYVAETHELERRALLRGAAAAALAAHIPEGGAIVGFSSVIWRESWKYGIRGFRYCQHDVGHAMAALGVSAAMHGMSAVAVPGVADDGLEGLLGLNRASDFDEHEEEHADVLMVVSQASDPAALQRVVGTIAGLVAAAGAEASASDGWRGKSTPLSLGHRRWPAIGAVSAATRHTISAATEVGSRSGAAVTKDEEPSGVCVTNPGHTPAPQLSSPTAASIVRQRRSAQSFDRSGKLARAQFVTMLRRVMPGAAVPPWSVWPSPWPHSAAVALYVHNVDDVEPGIYLLLRTDDGAASIREAMGDAGHDWDRLDGEDVDMLPLWRLRRGDVRRRARLINCDQEIAGDGAFSASILLPIGDVSIVPDAALYRRQFWEAGLVGHALYHEAEAAGVGGTGMGCFFDNAVHDALGLPHDGRWQCLYGFAVGVPVMDTRVRSGAPFEE